MILPDWMYQCLDRFGNTVISETRYKSFDEQSILDELKSHGYVCEIVIYDDYDECNGQDYNYPRRKPTKTYVIELRGKCDAVV